MKSINRKFLRRYASITIVALLPILGIWSFISSLTRDNRIAKDPTRIAKEAHFDLPAYDVIFQENNMDRNASAWSAYMWDLKLKEPLDEKIKGKLDRLVRKDPRWVYNPDNKTYSYVSEETDRTLTIQIRVMDKMVSMDYDWWDILS